MEIGGIMFKNKHTDGKKNICGKNIAKLRMNMKPFVSQRALAEKLQVIGIDLDKNAIQKIESGIGYVTDIELLAFAKIFNVTTDELLK